MAQKCTVPAVRDRKVARGGEPLVMLTAYDAPGARMVDRAGADMILVGDSVAMVVLGYDDTLQVTVEDIAHHTAAVARTHPSALVIADMPWMSYHVSTADTVNNAAMLIRAGAQAVKLEGGRRRIPMIEALVAAEIPVMGHIGLTPQSINSFGGYRVQGRDREEAAKLLRDAKALEDAGAYAIVLELVPTPLAGLISRQLTVPTIGIGAGVECDGQVQVLHDMLGLFTDFVPRHAKQYAQLAESIKRAFAQYVQDVECGSFPTGKQSFGMDEAILEELTVLP